MDNSNNINNPKDSRSNDKDVLSKPARENIETLAERYEQEKADASYAQRVIERLAQLLGNPIYFAIVTLFILLWILINVYNDWLGIDQFDKPPFFWLQGIISLNSTLLTIAVLIRQNRMEVLAQQRAHLDLHINLITEQKTAKILQVLKEIRKEFPNLKHRQDKELDELEQPTDPDALLNAIKSDELRVTQDKGLQKEDK